MLATGQSRTTLPLIRGFQGISSTQKVILVGRMEIGAANADEMRPMTFSCQRGFLVVCRPIRDTQCGDESMKRCAPMASANLSCVAATQDSTVGRSPAAASRGQFPVAFGVLKGETGYAIKVAVEKHRKERPTQSAHTHRAWGPKMKFMAEDYFGGLSHDRGLTPSTHAQCHYRCDLSE